MTIRDIARKANVSISTVSLAINNDPRVKTETRQKIFEITEQYGYRPTHAARSLSIGKTWSITVINPSDRSDLTTGFGTRFLHGVHEAAALRRYTVSLSIIESESEAIQAAENFASERNTDGVILMNPSESDALIEKLRERRMPHVMLGRAPTSGVPSVDNDSFQVGYDSAMHMLECGFFPIMFVSGPSDATVTQDRLEGFLAAHADSGQQFDESLLVHSNGDAQSAFTGTKELIESRKIVGGVIALSDAQALGALRALRLLGLRVPEDVGIMGMNNDDITEYTEPSLTSMELNAFQLGMESGRLLCGLIDGEDIPPETIITPHRLIPRASTASGVNHDR